MVAEHNGGDSEMHAHVLGAFDMSEVIRQAMKASQLHDAVSKAAEEAKKAITNVMRVEYEGLAARAREHDSLLKDGPIQPNLQQCAEAYGRHTLAAEAADKLGKMNDDDDRDYGQEFLAQAHEHRAQTERWVVKIRNAVKLEERAAAAEAKTEGEATKA